MTGELAATPIIDALAAFAATTTLDDLPADVIHATKRVLLDTVGCAIAGLSTDAGRAAVEIAVAQGGTPESSVLGTEHRLSASNAVFANGQLANVLDFDTVMPGGHTPPYIVPVALAMAERTGASGRELLVATAIGLEIAARLAAATPLPMQFVGDENAFRYAAREGFAKLNFGAAAAAGRLNGLSAARIREALAHAGHLSQVNTWTRGNYALPRNLAKYGFPGWQGTGAVLSVLYAELGLPGDVTLLDDIEHGYGEFSGYEAWDPEMISDRLGDRWSFGADVRFKPYPCCTALHPAIEAFERILRDARLAPDEIERVTVATSPTVDAALFQDRTMRNIVDFQFSMFHVLAMAAHREPPGPEWQNWDKVTDARMGEFAERVVLLANPRYGDDEETVVTVHARGAVFRQVRVGWTDPMTQAALVEKFRSNVSGRLSAAKIDAAIGDLLDLENVDRSAQVIAVLTR